LDFVAAIEKCSVREAAVKLQDWFTVGSSAAPTSTSAETAPEERPTFNKPLGFQLKGINHEHTYLKDRTISNATAQSFGVGFFSGKGSMSGRVVIPIHNERGELLGVCRPRDRRQRTEIQISTGLSEVAGAL